MRLAIDRSEGAQAVDVPCIVCGKRSRLSTMVSDADGQAFVDYYHIDCLPDDAPNTATQYVDGRAVSVGIPRASRFPAPSAVETFYNREGN